MADLLTEFFNRDLTEAEEQRLGELLSSSPEQSSRFADLAHSAYLQTGLPDSGAGGSNGLGGSGGVSPLLGPVILKSVVALTLLGLLTYGSYRLIHDVPNPSVSLPSAVAPKTAPPEKIKLIKPVSAASEPASALPIQALRKPGTKPGTSPSQASALASLKNTKPGMVNPVAYDPAKKYEGLDIMVEQKNSGLLTVRALDSSKNEVRLLFAGMVKPGKWDFVWDGKTESGEPAEPGTYRVEVQSGKDVLNKEVVIRGESIANQK